MRNPVNRSAIDIEEVEQGADLETTIFTLNKLLNHYNYLTRALSIQSNFDGFIAENVVIPSLTEIKIQHFLGIRPKWRIILRQVGNGVLTDVASNWDNKVIALYNNGAVEVTATIFIARE